MDWEKVRKQFPVTEKYVYLNLANQCALPTFSTNVMLDYIKEQQDFGGNKQEWLSLIENTRVKVSQLINCSQDEIAFVKNTSEGLNIAANSLNINKGQNILLNKSEHPNNIYCWLNLQKKNANIIWLPTVNGEVKVEEVRKTINSSTKVLAISSTTFAPGNRNNIKEIVNICQENGIISVIDASQSIGTIEFDVQDIGMDIMCTTAHKALFCPHGVGILYVSKKIIDQLEPMYIAKAGIETAQEIDKQQSDFKVKLYSSARKFEIGNYNYLGLAVLNRNIEYLLSIGMQEIERRIIELNMYCTSGLKELNVYIAGPQEIERKSSILCFYDDNANGLHAFLAKHRVITTLRRGMIRVSFGIYNNKKDVDILLSLIKEWKGISKPYLL